MPRTPVHALAAQSRPSGRDAMWQEIRRRREFTISEVTAAATCHNSSARAFVLALQKAGIVEDTGTIAPPHPAFNGRGSATQIRAKVYRLAQDPGAETPRVRRDGTISQMGMGREQLWRTLRYLKTFSARDLAIQASTQEVVISEAEARFYCKMLTHAGYLAASGGVEAAGTVYTFMPTKNTGPLPPKIQRTKHVFDANLGKVVWTGEAECL
jgi:hypothetical protein